MGDERDAFVAHHSRKRLYLLLLGSLGFVVGQLWMLGVFGDVEVPATGRRMIFAELATSPYFGWPAVAFFVWAATIIVRRIASPNNAVRVDALGISCAQHYNRAFSWDEITSIKFAPRFVLFEVTRDVRRDLSGWHRVLAATNRTLVGSSLAIATGSMDADREALNDAIRRFAPVHLTRIAG
ncbi:STM3941 family protein [Qipengyuania mesophila]|uniref:STM3941 family protein n=1 Tax=Qipengyuania mesophila TaxID=2867246 RepID=UPI003CD0CF89